MVKQTIAALAVLIACTTGATANGRPSVCPARLWCGCYLSVHLFGQSVRDLWRARNWASIGRPAAPGPGVVVVWRNHVGVIVSMTGPRTAVIHNGNDGRAVRTRERSIAGAIAFRAVGSHTAVSGKTWTGNKSTKLTRGLVSFGASAERFQDYDPAKGIGL